MAEETTTAPETTTTAPETTTTTTPVAKPGKLTLSTTPTTTTEQAPPEQTATGTPAKPDATLILGKFKDQSALEKAYTELESMKGKQSAAPDAYDFEPLSKDGVVKFENDEQRAGFEKVLKDAGVSQDILAKSGPAIQMLAKQAGEAAIAAAQKTYAEQFGGPIDVQAQVGKLRASWGDQFETKFKVASDFLNSAPASITEMPLGWSAEGMQFLYDRLSAGRGPSLIKPGDSAPTADLAALRSQLNDLMKGAYRKNTPDGERARSEASRIAAQIAQLEGRK
jgi:hypothetical protein